MPHRACPKCGNPGRFLQVSSQWALVEYYRCDGCGHVWAYDRQDPSAPARDITPRDKNDEETGE